MLKGKLFSFLKSLFKKLKAIKYFFLVIFSGLLFSCIPQKKMVYFQNKNHQDTIVTFQDTGYMAVIQPNDILTIYVASVSAEASKYFNFIEKPDDANSMANGYLVDTRGNIQMPLVGDVKVSGLTSAMARDTIVSKMIKYLINPSVKLNIRNFRVTVMGEVLHPGVFTVPNEKITLPEELALAGDLTVFSTRENIMVIRELNGKKEFGIVDLTNRDLFNSPFYNLHCNDIVYVEPMKQKKFLAQNYYRVLPIIFGGVVALIAVYGLTK